MKILLQIFTIIHRKLW